MLKLLDCVSVYYDKLNVSRLDFELTNNSSVDM